MSSVDFNSSSSVPNPCHFVLTPQSHAHSIHHHFPTPKRPPYALMSQWLPAAETQLKPGFHDESATGLAKMETDRLPRESTRWGGGLLVRPVSIIATQGRRLSRGKLHLAVTTAQIKEFIGDQSMNNKGEHIH